MPNILTVPASGIISFDSRTGTDFNVPNLENSVRIAYDSNGGLNINSYVTGVSGVERFSIDGTQGRLFSVTDILTGTLFSVNNIAGLPILEVKDFNTVIAGKFNTNALVVSGSQVALGLMPYDASRLGVSGNVNVIGNITASGNINASGANFNNRITINQTGVLLSGDAYPSSNPSGFITGVDLSNYVTKTNAEFTNRPTVNGTGILLSGEGGASTSTSKIIDKFTPSSNQPSLTRFATLDTRSSVLVLDYDDTVTESGTFIGMIPETAGTITGLQVRILWTATTATGNNCRWGARFADLSSSGINAPFDLGTEVNSAANSVSGITSTADIVCSGTAGLMANEFYRLLVYRNSADTVNDTMVGDAELISVTTYLT